MSPAPFGSRLGVVTTARGPLCVGIDPHPGLLEAWGLPDDPSGLERFGRGLVAALGEAVAVFKPQSAFFERHGSRGVAVLEQVIADVRDAGALVLLDVKRGDIGSTVQAYADAYVRTGSPLCADAVTASPYLGFESLRPLLDTAAAHGNGVFVLALTSNPEGPEVQHARGADGRTVAGVVLDHVRAANAASAPEGSVGVVVGATVGSVAGDVDLGAIDLDVDGPILAPGIGAQGGTAADLERVFGPALPHVLPSVSREILRAGPEPDSLREATFRTLDAVRGVLVR